MYLYNTEILYFRLSCGSILWTTLLESRKVLGVYADIIKDFILLMIIFKAVGGFYVFQDSELTFAATVSQSR